jgi:hypothetical protein
MAENIEHVVNRNGWPAGPWDAEPENRVEWRHEGVPCLLVRHPRYGHWCGYAAVEPGHPWHGKDYDDVPVDVHGGLTYADKCGAIPAVCHVPQPGEPDDVWWLGFDCAHARDMSPGMWGPGMWWRVSDEVYRDQRYVQQQTDALAEQVIAAREPVAASTD